MLNQLNTLAIINPISGNGKQKHIENLLKQHIDESKFQLTIKMTQYAGHASELTKEAIEKRFDLVIAIGGDGTINEIASALTFSNVAMGIIPCGSGNGLARHLGIPMNAKKAIQYLNKAKINSMDTACINEHRFVNVAGIGFDALIAHQFANMNSRGFISYIKAVLTSFRTFKCQKFKLTSNKHLCIEEGMMLSFCNSSQFGNNAFIAPSAKIDDGKLNLCLLQKPKWYQIPSLTFKTFTRKIESSSLFKEFMLDEVEIVHASQLGHVDGEPIVIGEKIKLKVDANSLKILS
ncbi:diacylglycerol/lipid kinase family protein [Marinifilum sp. D737]|jgi:YegS/Rv2252/BmrU family lipid kinase|uniref:diacylglycerol/lipid kinase family protein n=1 Tax=Marinifilum sp. D737 TaxID=2969628 RepID=UPI0022767FE5|nr:YegS/Rv2252/BmrU family lipid kinase [Marinifilum sp. D737]MCY1634673.1 YegS/Rv2252/BmrU family lipid kinase [Marinifilum sp. D737]